MATIALLHFDGAYGPTGAPKDVIGNTWTLSGGSAAPYIDKTAGVFGGALVNPSGGAIEYTWPSSITSPLTIEFRVKTEASGTGSTNILMVTPAGGGTQYFGLSVSNFALRLVTTGNVNTPIITCAPSTWYAIALQNDGTNLTVYVNGALTLTFATPTFTLPLVRVALAPNSVFRTVDELRISDVALYPTDYTPATAPFEPLEQTQTNVTQIKQASLDAQSVAEEPMYTAVVPQLVVHSVTGQTVDAPTITTTLTQIKQASLSVTNDPLPIDFVYVPQVQVVSVTYDTGPTPEPRHNLTQFKAQALTTTEGSTDGLVYGVNQQVIRATEDAEWQRLYSAEQLLTRQDFVTATTYLNSLDAVGLVQDDLPADPPSYSYHTSEQVVSAAPDYADSLSLQSPTKAHSTASSVLVADLYPDAWSLQSLTQAFSLQQQVLAERTMADPETLKSGSTNSAVSQSTVQATPPMVMPLDIRSHTLQSSLHQQVVQSDPLTDPFDIQSLTRAMTLSQMVAVRDMLVAPLDIRSKTHSHTASEAVIAPNTTFRDPYELKASTISLATTELVLTREYMSNPASALSALQSLALRQSLLQPDDSLADPQDVRSATKGLKTVSTVLTESVLVNPWLIANTKNRHTSSAIIDPALYKDPYSLQSPMRSTSVASHVVSAFSYENPIDIKARASLHNVGMTVVNEQSFVDPINIQHTKNRHVSEAVVGEESMADPYALQSKTRNRAAAEAVIAEQTYMSLDYVRSYTRSFKTMGQVVMEEVMVNPILIQKPTINHHVAPALLAVQPYQEPGTIGLSVLNHSTDMSVTSRVVMRDPAMLAVSLRNSNVSADYMSPERYSDPDLILPGPLRNHGTTMNVMEPEVYTNPAGFASGAIVNVHYYWKH